MCLLGVSLDRCIVAGANMPKSADLVAKAFKPLLSAAPTPERAQALKTLAKALGADGITSPQPGALVKALRSCGALASVAECLKSAPGQESAARCTYFAARAETYTARTLVDERVELLLLPLLIAPDDGLQQWAAAALAPVLAGDPFRASKSIIEAGGVFTIVALLSSSSPDVRSHALAALISLCSGVIEAAWPKSAVGSEEAKGLLCKLVDGAIDAGICHSIIALLEVRDDVRVATAALEAVIALSYSSKSFRHVLRSEIGGNVRLSTQLVTACGDRRFGAHALRVMADACYCVDEQTGAEDRVESAAASDAARGLFAAGALPVAIEALGTEFETSMELNQSLLLEASTLQGAEARGCASPGNSKRDDGARIAAALLAHAPGAAEECLVGSQARMVAALVSVVAFELAPSLAVREGKPRAVAALPALTLCVSASARQHDARPAVEAAQAGILELLATHNFFDASLGYSLDHTPCRGLVATRSAMLVHALIMACWRDSNEGSLLVLALAAPPNGHTLSRLCGLLDGLVSTGLAISDAGPPHPHLVDSLMTAILLALGSLCGAARPYGRAAHPSEKLCKRDVVQSLGCGLAIAAGLSHESREVQPCEKRRAAARLLASLLRSDCEQPNDSISTTAEPHHAVAEALAQSGLVGVAAACLTDDDAIIRADAVDAFTVLSTYALREDRDVALGAAALGDNLSRGIVASDAAAKHSSSGCTPELVPLRATIAVEKALQALGAACCRGGVAARDAVAFSTGCAGAFISLTRAPLSAPSDFGVRCAAICLTAIAALAKDAEGRASALADAGACDAVALALVAAMRDKDGSIASLQTAALSAMSAFSSFHSPRQAFTTTETPVLAALFLCIVQVDDAPSFECGHLALSTLVHFAHPTVTVSEPQTASKLATAAKQCKIVAALTHVLNGAWRPFCVDTAQHDLMMRYAHELITALANAPATMEGPTDIDTLDGDTCPLDVLVNDRTAAVSSVYASESTRLPDEAISAAKLKFPSSAELVASDEKQHFEQRYGAWFLRHGTTNDSKLRHKTTALAGADMAALVSLITAPEPLDDAERITAHLSAVDCACTALEDIIVEDAAGTTAALAIQGGVLTRLLMLAPRSPAAAMCLVALCEVGELHRPLMLSMPTPTITAKFADTIIEMLCVMASAASRDESDVNIVQASVHFMCAVCRDSDLAVLALAITLMSRNRLSTALGRLAIIAVAEATVESTTDINATQPGALVLISMLAPRLHDATDGHDNLFRVDSDFFPSGGPPSLPASMSSLLDAIAVDDSSRIRCVDAFSKGVTLLLDTAAVNAIAKATPALLRVLLALPPGSLRARARRAIAIIAAEIAEATRYLLGAGAVEAAVRLVVEAKGTPGKTAASDAAFGCTLLASLVSNAKSRAARAALAHDGLMPALVTCVVQATAYKTSPLAFAALSLVVNLADAGDDAAAHVASSDDLLQALVTLAAEIVSPVTTGLPLNAATCNQIYDDGSFHREHTDKKVHLKQDPPPKATRQNRMHIAEKALLALANIAIGPRAQREALANVNGILHVAVGILRNAKPGIAQAAAARLVASLLEAHVNLDAEADDATFTAATLCGALTIMTERELHAETALRLVHALNALLCYAQGADALQSSQPTSVLAMLLKVTMTRYPEVAEVCDPPNSLDRQIFLVGLRCSDKYSVLRRLPSQSPQD